MEAEIFDKAHRPVPLIKAPKWYCARISDSGEEVNILMSLPLNPADTHNRNYTYRIRLQTSSGEQIISMEGMFRGGR